MQLKSANDFLAREHSSKTIAFKPIYHDITGDLVAGLLLSQIICWHLPDTEGKIKLRVERDSRFWLCKSMSEWYKEIRISEKQYDIASNILRELNIIDVETFKFGGTPKLHIALNYDVLIGLLNAELKKYSSNSKSLFSKTEIVKAEPKEDKYKSEIKEILSTKNDEYREMVNEFKKMRVKIKKPMTDLAVRNMLRRIERFYPNNNDKQLKSIEQSIDKTWQDVYLLPEDNRKTRDNY